MEILVKRGWVFHKLEKYNESLECYERANHILANLGDTKGYVDNLLSQAELLFYDMGEYVKARMLLHEVIAICEENSFPGLHSEAVQMLRDINDYIAKK